MAHPAVTEHAPATGVPAAAPPPAVRRGPLPWILRHADWLGPIAVALFAGLLRFWGLAKPDAFVFDETYYPKDAWSLLHQGYEGVWPDLANREIISSPQKIPLTAEPAFIAHPPLGKWVIALGEWVFGLHPFGWRVMVALLGTLSVLMLARIGRRLFSSTLLGCTAALLMAVDGLHFVMSRVGLLDGVSMFFVLGAFGCLLVDRDRTRQVLAAARAEGGRAADEVRLGLRPWRIGAGALLGCAAAVKWNGLQVLLVFTVLTLLWDRAGRRGAGAHRPTRSLLRRDLLPGLLSTVGVALLVYTASWTGWFASDGGFDRHWADHRAGLSMPRTPVVDLPLPQVPMTWVPSALRSWWHYHAQMYDFNTGLTSPHTYQSNPWSWLVQGRPVSMYWQQLTAGQDGCTANGGCASQILALGTPLLWWAACFALAYALWRWAFRRDWRSGAILAGVAGTYLPWFGYQERTIFSFYMVILVPFLCLAVAQMLGAMLGPAGCSRRRRIWGAAGAGLVVFAVVGCFAYFYPLYTAEVIPMSEWQDRMWFTSWI
ncbi:dolichyl-phosphate-mannose--protein mannosyltransferase [Streptomyces sp. NRRL B-24484]|uniref:dolichyl-phosphate-mannose--protein mannosyltransferase n=1 Tax=Streptomyces sp. NRRL B-24484 TaxID=1463833 RepID=UPI0009972D5F|nr:phospholipid carrier-dependent glycosyltransferase [Streptomyces sp. NRRL B-24484]